MRDLLDVRLRDEVEVPNAGGRTEVKPQPPPRLQPEQKQQHARPDQAANRIDHKPLIPEIPQPVQEPPQRGGKSAAPSGAAP